MEEDAENGSDEFSQLKEGTDLVILQLGGGFKHSIKLVSEYIWSKNGKLLVVASTHHKKEKSVRPQVTIFRSAEKDWILFSAKQIRSKTWPLMKTATRLRFMQKWILPSSQRRNFSNCISGRMVTSKLLSLQINIQSV